MYENTKTRAAIVFQAVLIFFCVFLAIFCLFPLVNILAVSLSSPQAILNNAVFLWPIDFNILSYEKVLANTSFTTSMWYTILLTVGYAAVAMVMTILCAYPLSKKSLKGRTIFMYLIVFTMYFDPGIIPNYLVVKDFDLLNKTASLILPIAISAYNMIIMRNFFSAIDGSILESATIDGCSEFGALVRIVLPLSTAVLATLSLFYIVSRWNGITDAIFYINDPNKYTLQLVLKEIVLAQQASSMDASQASDIGKTAADAVKAASVFFATIPILLVYPFAQKYFTKGIMMGSVKG